MLSNKNDIVKQYQHIKLYYENQSFIHPSYHLELQLLDSIISRNEKHAKELLDKLNSTKRAHLSDNIIRSFKNSLICDCTLFTRAVIKAGANYEQAFALSDACIQQIERTSNLEELSKLEYSILSAYINIFDHNDENKYSDVIIKAINFIQNNILKPIKLEDIASHVFLSPNYLSTKFKEETKISLADYINKTKIEESKYLLLYSNTSISDIALTFNFCNQSYYTNLFKKYNQFTPKEFRNMSL